MKYPLLSGRTPVAYHAIPSELSFLLTTPIQESIMAYLSEISANAFPEFVKDILIKVEKHTLVDILDGPGDEKLDILTITPDGKKCLIQCKHTGSYHSKRNGDDLDLMVSACIRKACQNAIYVTNGDLTTQAKRYVVDGEYSKGLPLKDLLNIDYWNGYKIWEKIHSNMDILNKWFGGLGQMHGLRSFKFDISIQKMPYCQTDEEDIIGDVLTNLMEKSKMEEVEKDISYKGKIDEEFDIYIKRWVQFSSNLDINYLSPEEDPHYNNKPMDCLSVEVIIMSNHVYYPNSIRKKIIQYLLENCLKDLPHNNWWHIVSGRSTSFVFIHDINEPRQIALDGAETFLKVKDYVLCSELDYCSLPKNEFIVSDIEEESGCYTHSNSGCYVVQYFVQKVAPFDEFNYKGIQQRQWEELENFTFRIIADINRRIMTHLTNILPIDWHSFQMDAHTLAWCYPNDADPVEVIAVEKEIRLLGLRLMAVKTEDLPYLLKNIDMSASEFIIHNNLESIRFPIFLKRRIFLISKSFPFDKKVDIDWFRNLAQYKINYEKEFGNFVFPEEEFINCRNFELPYILSDVKNIRGHTMLDINVWDSPIQVTMRFREEKIIPSKEIVLEAIKEFEKVFNDIYSKFG